MRRTTCILAIALAGCASSPEVSTTDRRAAEDFVQKEQRPLVARPVALWYASDEPGFLLCGEIEAPAALQPERSTLRYVYDRERRYGQVELHDLVVTGSTVTQSLIDANRRMFDATWQAHCQPHTPLSRRVVSWLPSSVQPSQPASDEDRYNVAMGEYQASQDRLNAMVELTR